MKLKFRPGIFRHFRALLIVFLLPVVTDTDIALAQDNLWALLRDGGMVVLMRHAPVERGNDKGDPLLRDVSCKNERNLSDRGKRSAELIGDKFREKRIPVHKVLHSPYCRTTTTAKLAFGTAYPATYLSLLEVLSVEESDQQTARLSQVIDTFSGEGNLILITHEPNINAVSFELMKHLDILVIDPNGENEFEELGVIRFSGTE